MNKNEQIVFLKKLSKGIDPTTDMEFKEDTILNNNTIKNGIKEILDSFIEMKKCYAKGNNPGNSKADFCLDIEDIKKIKTCDEQITVSKLSYLIDSASTNQKMKKFRATQITKWLEKEGYLKTVFDINGNPRKIPTKAGEKLGIERSEKENSIGKMYSANLYNRDAQQFIIDNLKLILKNGNDDYEKEYM